MTNVAWIGLGAMGGRMARRLAADGHDLTVWNRTPSRAEEFSLAVTGVRAVGSLAEAVRGAEVVFLMLADPAAVAAVAEGPGGIAAAIPAGATVVDMSTAGPAAVARLRSALPERVTLLDVPVLGSLAEAEAGGLVLLAGGPDDVVARLWPLLSVLGEPVHLGPVGTGAAAKLVANLALLGTVGVLGEALSLADALGLPRPATWRALARTPLAAQVERRRPAVESGVFPPRFTLGLARKDADLIVAAADRAEVDASLARATRRWLTDAEAAGLGSLDYTAVLKHIPSSRRPCEPTAPSNAVAIGNAPHYSWGDRCDGWRLLDDSGLSVIEERMPPGTAEGWHVHDYARQFFYVLDGVATMRTLDGESRLPASSGVHVAPGTPHQMVNTGGQNVRFLVISAPNSRSDRHPYTAAVPPATRR